MRIERDMLGGIEVPVDALWGAATQRAIENFPISGLRFPRAFIAALGGIKAAAAHANRALGLLPPQKAAAIAQAANEVMDGVLDRHFVVDIFQTGSGTSTNTNANEVIARRAAAILRALPGSLEAVHPNDDVNRGQSSNDVIPTALHIAALRELRTKLIPALELLSARLQEKSAAWSSVVTIGRTHLGDALPITLGQEISGHAEQIRNAIRRIESAYPSLREIPLGGTAVGTGFGAHPDFARRAIMEINDIFGIDCVEAPNRFEAQGAQDGAVEVSGHLKTLAVSLTKIANDIRWRASGPRAGLGEVRAPPMQPGSSMMPGKVNPVICEALLMAAARVIGNDTTVTLGGLSGNFELNTMLPIIAFTVLESITILANSSTVFAERCIAGLEVDRAVCLEYAERSLALATALAPLIGYDRAAELAASAAHESRTVRAAAHALHIAPPPEIERQLDLDAIAGVKQAL